MPQSLTVYQPNNGTPPALASVPGTPGIRYGATHNASNNPNARQPGIVRTGSGRPTDGGTATLPIAPVALSGDKPRTSKTGRVPPPSVRILPHGMDAYNASRPRENDRSRNNLLGIPLVGISPQGMGACHAFPPREHEKYCNTLLATHSVGVYSRAWARVTPPPSRQRQTSQRFASHHLYPNAGFGHM